MRPSSARHSLIRIPAMADTPRLILPRDEIRRCNSRTAELVSLYLNLSPDAIKPETVNELATACGFSRERAFAEILAVLCGLDAAGADKALFRNYFIPMVHELDPEEFEADAYYKNIRIKEKKLGKWELSVGHLAPCEAFVCRDFVVTDRGELIPQLGFFMRDFSYPAVLEGGREWMTLMPNETVTTLPAIHRANGRVLTYGLGLGYFAYMCSEKPEVTSVTVVERSYEAAELFRAVIHPQFSHPEKINIIIGDAVEFAERRAPSLGFDFIFADIWHDVGDGRALYRTFKSFEALYPPSTEFSYWLEDTILCYEREELWAHG